MVVTVLGVIGKGDEGLAAVPGHPHYGVHLVDVPLEMRARENLLVVVRTGAARQVVVLLLP